jgi:hypothetical protein
MVGRSSTGEVIMSGLTCPFRSQESNRSDFANRILEPLARHLMTGEPSATIDRLFSSEHVKDLRLIVAVTIFGAFLVLVWGLVFSIDEVWVAKPEWTLFPKIIGGLAKFITFAAPILGVLGVVLAWAYQAGSARLGVVDLFACEISTLCRVATVADTAHRYSEKYRKAPPPKSVTETKAASQTFASKEEYFPVFENSTKDLQALEARVVINVTAFYTYMKAFRDSLRGLAEIMPSEEELATTCEKTKRKGPWHAALVDSVYMLFLAMESARHSICDLVEFQPEKAERLAVVLISELEAWAFLIERFPNGEAPHRQRLMLRIKEYREVPALIDLIKAGAAGKSKETKDLWAPAAELLTELQKRYRAVAKLFGQGDN